MEKLLKKIDLILYGPTNGNPLQKHKMHLIVINITNPDRAPYEDELRLLRSCDMYNIPLATNIAPAECLISAIGNGDLNWREFINPTSDYSKRKRANH